MERSELILHPMTGLCMIGSSWMTWLHKQAKCNPAFCLRAIDTRHLSRCLFMSTMDAAYRKEI